MQSRLGQLEKPGQVPTVPVGGLEENEDSAMDESGDGNEGGKSAEDEELERYGVTASNLDPVAKAGLLQFFRSQHKQSNVSHVSN